MNNNFTKLINLLDKEGFEYDIISEEAGSVEVDIAGLRHTINVIAYDNEFYCHTYHKEDERFANDKCYKTFRGAKNYIFRYID